jgi:hypothetical protein
MCRNIKPLFNFDPPATETEIRDAALQFVRKISGYNHPSQANERAFNQAIDEIAIATQRMLDTLSTDSPKRNREEEVAKAKARAAKRWGSFVE